MQLVRDRFPVAPDGHLFAVIVRMHICKRARIARPLALEFSAAERRFAISYRHGITGFADDSTDYVPIWIVGLRTDNEIAEVGLGDAPS